MQLRGLVQRIGSSLTVVPFQISARTASLLTTLAVRGGIARSSLPVSPEELDGSFVDWDRYLELMEAVEAAAGGPEPFIALCARFGEVMPDLRGLFSLPRLTDAAALLARSYVRMAYPMMTLRVELVAPGQIHIGYRLPTSARGSISLARSLIGTFRGLPRLGALPDAEVIVERLGPHAFDSLVVLPEEPTSLHGSPPSLAEDTTEGALSAELLALRAERATIERIVSSLVFGTPPRPGPSGFAELAAQVVLRESGARFVRILRGAVELARAGEFPRNPALPAVHLSLDDLGSGMLEVDANQAGLLRAVAPWIGRELARRSVDEGLKKTSPDGRRPSGRGGRERSSKRSGSGCSSSKLFIGPSAGWPGGRPSAIVVEGIAIHVEVQIGVEGRFFDEVFHGETHLEVGADDFALELGVAAVVLGGGHGMCLLFLVKVGELRGVFGGGKVRRWGGSSDGGPAAGERPRRSATTGASDPAALRLSAPAPQNWEARTRSTEVDGRGRRRLAGRRARIGKNHLHLHLLTQYAESVPCPKKR